MGSQQALLIIGLIILVIVLINLAIIYSIKRRSNTVGQVELFRRAMKKAQNPWQEEQEKLRNLSDQVKKLKESKTNGNNNDK